MCGEKICETGRYKTVFFSSGQFVLLTCLKGGGEDEATTVTLTADVEHYKLLISGSVMGVG